VTAAVVGVMDRDSWTARTDNLVVVDATRRRVSGCPGISGSDAVGDRINEAFSQGGHDLLEAAVREHGLPAESSVVLLRSGVERALEGLRVTVRVDRGRRYWYPLAPMLRLEDGRKLVCFDPPQEELSGERIHQWLGARRSADDPAPTLPDLDRIERPQVLVRTLLEDGFAFAKALEDPALTSIAGSRALEVGAVRATWDFETYRRFQPATVEGKMVLIGRRRRLLTRRRRVQRVTRQ
jgi:hypothetical protein